MTLIPLPPSSASPEEVRAYFSSILAQNHPVPGAEAAQLVKEWKYGTGAEVRTLDVATYRAIFGAEIGSLLWTC
jgi:hypothetical protein